MPEYRSAIAPANKLAWFVIPSLPHAQQQSRYEPAGWRRAGTLRIHVSQTPSKAGSKGRAGLTRLRSSRVAGVHSSRGLLPDQSFRQRFQRRTAAATH